MKKLILTKEYHRIAYNKCILLNDLKKKWIIIAIFYKKTKEFDTLKVKKILIKI